MNVVAEELTGIAFANAVGRPLADVMKLTDPQTGRPDRQLSAEVLPEGAARALLVSPAGIVSTLERRTTPIFDNDGVLCGAVWVFRDITDAVLLEEERMKASKLESLGLLAGGIAHDFNNILTAVVGNVYLAKDAEGIDAETRELIVEAERACMRAQALTTQLLTFSKGGAPVRTVAAIGAMVKESAAFALRGSNVACECNVPADLWEVDGDVRQLSDVVQHLVINAKQAMPSGGVMTLDASNVELAQSLGPLAPGRYVRLDVADHGCGIPDAVLPKIFDPYFTTKPRCSGLGLATAYSILKAHNGHIAVESAVGVGTRVSVFVPVATLAAKPRSVAGDTARPGGRVLVMDDEPAIRTLAARLLKRMGYDVETAADGAAAIDAFIEARHAGRPFDLVMMDLTVPGAMGGVEAIERLRAIDPQVRALVSSGYADSDVMSRYEAYGFRGIVSKPFVLPDLKQAVDRVFQAA
jgi:signal transduction histidine kinase/CheY-like chemotaxis protein